MKKEKLEKIVEFSPAYDKRNTNPKKDHGIGAVRIRFVLKGKKGAVQFLMGTNWFLPETIAEYKTGFKSGITGEIKTTNLLDEKNDCSGISGWDIGYHSKKPMYEGHESIDENCPYTDGICYYDGSGLRAKDIPELLVRKGSDEIWKYLEKYYLSTFGE